MLKNSILEEQNERECLQGIIINDNLESEFSIISYDKFDSSDGHFVPFATVQGDGWNKVKRILHKTIFDITGEKTISSTLIFFEKLWRSIVDSNDVEDEKKFEQMFRIHHLLLSFATDKRISCTSNGKVESCAFLNSVRKGIPSCCGSNTENHREQKQREEEQQGELKEQNEEETKEQNQKELNKEETKAQNQKEIEEQNEEETKEQNQSRKEDEELKEWIVACNPKKNKKKRRQQRKKMEEKILQKFNLKFNYNDMSTRMIAEERVKLQRFVKTKPVLAAKVVKEIKKRKNARRKARQHENKQNQYVLEANKFCLENLHFPHSLISSVTPYYYSSKMVNEEEIKMGTTTLEFLYFVQMKQKVIEFDKINGNKLLVLKFRAQKYQLEKTLEFFEHNQGKPSFFKELTSEINQLQNIAKNQTKIGLQNTFRNLIN